MKSKFNARVLSLILTVAIISTMLPSNMVFAIGDNTNQPTVSAVQNDTEQNGAEQNGAEQSGENKQESPPENESEASPSEADKPAESEDGTLDNDISEPEAPECGCTEKCTAEKQSKDCPVCKDGFDKCTFVEPEATECGCTEKCTADKQSKDCPVCKDSFNKCTFVEPEAPECGCTEKCTADKQSKDCPVCKESFEKCAFVEPEAPKCGCTEKCTAEKQNKDCPLCKDGFEKCAFVEESAEYKEIIKRVKELLAWFDERMELVPSTEDESVRDSGPAPGLSRVNAPPRVLDSGTVPKSAGPGDADGTLDGGFGVGGGMTLRGKAGYILTEEDKNKFLDKYDAIIALADALMESDFPAFERLTAQEDFVRLHNIAQVVGGYAAMPLLPGEVYYAKGVPLTVNAGQEYRTVFGGSGSDSENVASTWIDVKGGTISESLFGGGNGDNMGKGCVVNGNTVINVENNSTVGLIVGGGVNSSKIMGNISVNIHGGTVKYVIAGGSGDTSTVGGKVILDITGGTITELVICGNGGTSNNIYLSGNSNIGTSGVADSGIKVEEFTAIKILGSLQSSNIKLIAPNAKQGTILATAEYEHYFRTDNFYGVPCYKDGVNLRYGYLPGVSGTTIYASGVPLVIEGTDTAATVYIDTNANGIRDGGELSLKSAGAENAPNDNSDLSAYTIYAGRDDRYGNCSPKITMNGGRVKSIYGGGLSVAGGQSANLSGTSFITVNKNATVTGDIHGGGHDKWAAGAKITHTVINVGGTVGGTIYGGGHADYTQHANSYPQVGIAGTVTIAIAPTGNVKNIYGGGHITGTPTSQPGDYKNANANVDNSVTISINGTVNGLVCGGGFVEGYLNGGTANVAKTTIQVNTGGKVYGTLYGGGNCSVNAPNAATMVTSANIEITGGEVRQIFGGGYSNTAHTATNVTYAAITLSGGKIVDRICRVIYATEQTNATLNVKGNPVIAGGIQELNKFVGAKVNITGALTSGASILLVNDLALNTIVATAASGVSAADSIQYFKSADAEKGFEASGQNIKLITQPKPTVEGKNIFGNGSALVIRAEGEGTTVHWDKNRNGMVDSGELSLYEAGVANAPQNGASLFDYIIYGGSQSAAVNGNTLITMTGGYVDSIFGGGEGTGNSVALINGSTKVRVSGGGGVRRNIAGGGQHYARVIQNAEVEITGGSYTHVYAGGHTNSDVDGKASLLIQNATVSNVYGAGYAYSTVGSIEVTLGNASIVNSDFKLTGLPSCRVFGTKRVNVEGNITLGETVAIDLSTLTDGKVYITGALTGASDGIKLTGLTNPANGTVVATANNAAWAIADKFMLPGTALYTDGVNIKTNNAGMPTVSTNAGDRPMVSGNGSALIVEADGAGTTVYWDKNRNGIVDAGDKSLAAAGVIGAPENGANLSTWDIAGGKPTPAAGTLTGDTLVTMLGGKVLNIYGGSYSSYSHNGSTYVNMSGGVVVDSILGGGYSTTNLTGKSNVNITGGKVGVLLGGMQSGSTGGANIKVGGTAEITNISGGSAYGGVNGHITITISDNAKISGYITGGTGLTSTAPGSLPYEITGNVSINLNGGTVSKAVTTQGKQVIIKGNQAINVSGKPVVGDKATNGIMLSDITAKKVNITAPLTGNAGDITLTGLTNPAEGTIVATAATGVHADASKFTLAGAFLETDGGNVVVSTAFTALEIRKDTADGAVVVDLLNPSSVARNWALDTEADYYLYAALKKNAAADYIQIRYGTGDKYNGVTFANPPGGGFAAGSIRHDYFDSLSAYKDFENPAYGSSTAKLALRDGTLTYHINSSIAANSPLNFSVGLVVNDAVYDGKNRIADALSVAAGSYSGGTFTPKTTRKADLKISDKNTIRSSMIQTASTAELDGIGSTVYSYPIYNADSLKQAAVLFDTYTVEVTYPKGAVLDYGFSTAFAKTNSSFGTVTLANSGTETDVGGVKYVTKTLTITNGYKPLASTLVIYYRLDFYNNNAEKVTFTPGTKYNLSLANPKINMDNGTVIVPNNAGLNQTVTYTLSSGGTDATTMVPLNRPETYNHTIDMGEDDYLSVLGSVYIKNNSAGSESPYEKTYEADFNTENTAAKITLITVPIGSFTTVNTAQEGEPANGLKVTVTGAGGTVTLSEEQLLAAAEKPGNLKNSTYLMIYAKDIGLTKITGVKAEIGKIPAGYTSCASTTSWTFLYNKAGAYGSFTDTGNGNQVNNTYRLYNTDPSVRDKTNGDLTVKSFATSTTESVMAMSSGAPYLTGIGEDRKITVKKAVIASDSSIPAGDMAVINGTLFPNASRTGYDKSVSPTVYAGSMYMEDPIIYLSLPAGLGLNTDKMAFSLAKYNDRTKLTGTEPITGWQATQVSSGGQTTVYKITMPDGTVFGYYDNDGNYAFLNYTLAFTTDKSLPTQRYRLNDLVTLVAKNKTKAVPYVGLNQGTMVYVKDEPNSWNGGKDVWGIVKDKDESPMGFGIQQQAEIVVNSAIAVSNINGVPVIPEWASYSPSNPNSIVMLGQNSEGQVRLNINNTSDNQGKNFVLLLPIPKKDADMGDIFMDNPQGVALSMTNIPAAGSASGFTVKYAKIDAAYDTLSGFFGGGNYSVTDNQSEANALLITASGLNKGEYTLFFDYTVSDAAAGALDIFRPVYAYTVQSDNRQKTGGYVASAVAGSKIDGIVFHDHDGNGVMDGTDSGVSGIQVVAKDAQGRTETAVTGADGKYSFTAVRETSVTLTFTVQGSESLRFNVRPPAAASGTVSTVLPSSDGKSAVRSLYAGGDTKVNAAMSGFVKVSYDNNTATGGSLPADSEYTAGSTATVSVKPDNLVKTGYRFKEWNTMANGGGTGYQPGATFTITANTTLYAIWEIDSYLVTFNYRGATGGNGEASRQIEHNTRYGGGSGVTYPNPLPKPVKTGFSFSGWTRTVTGTTANVFDSTRFNLGVDTILYALYAPKNSYVVRYADTGSSQIPDKTGVAWDGMVLPEISPKKTGYIFAGWVCGGADIMQYTAFCDLAASDADNTAITLTATWRAKTGFTVKYDAAGGSDTLFDKTGVSWAQTNLLPTQNPTKANFAFDGWTLSGTAVTAADSYGTLAKQDTVLSVTLKAAWKVLADNMVRYDTAGGTAIADKNGVKATDTGLLPATAPTRAGYTFDGWYYGSGKVSAATAYNSLTTERTLTLTAKWNAKSYTIHYATGTAAAIADASKSWQETGLLPSDTLTKDGYLFDGWYHENARVTPSDTVSVLIPPDNKTELTLTARWLEKTYTIVYDTDGGSYIPPRTGIKYTATGLLPDTAALKTGYTLTSWSAGGTAVTESTALSALNPTGSSVTIKAAWSAKTGYTVIYDANGGSFANPDDQTKADVNWTDSSLLSAAAPARPGYILTGWKSGRTTVTADTAFSALAAGDAAGTAVTLVAQWAENANYAVKYNTDCDTSIADKTNVKWNQRLLLPSENLKREGYAFTGWYYAKQGGGSIKVVNTDPYSALAGADSNYIVLSAGWEEKQNYIVHYNTDGGGSIDDRNNVAYESTTNLLPAEVPVKYGEIFEGWSYQKENGGIISVTNAMNYASLAGRDTLQSITLTAKWAQKSFTIRYDENGGSTVEDRGGVQWVDSPITPEIESTRRGYHLIGWNYGDIRVTDNHSLGDILADDGSTVITLTAEWEERDYTIHYDTDGGNSIGDKTDVRYSDDGLLPAVSPEKAGYAFNGWYYGNTEVKNPIPPQTNEDGDVTVPTVPGTTCAELVGEAANDMTELTLKARWTVKGGYAVEYDTAGAGYLADKTGVKWADSALLPAADGLKKKGYTLSGWKCGNTPATADTAFSALAASDMSGTKVVLTAVWTEKSAYTVRYDLKGGTHNGSTGVAEKTGVKWTDTGLLPSPNPAKEHYTFGGWLLGENLVGNDTPYALLAGTDAVTSVTLSVKWNPISENTVKYETGEGGTVIADKTGVAWDDTGLLPAAPVRPGHTFTGWKCGNADVTAATKYSDCAAGTEKTITLTAQWTENSYTVQYDTAGGSTIADKTGVKWADSGLLPTSDPTREHYIFGGWIYGESTAATAATKYSDLAANDTVTTVALTAKWTQKDYTVHYNTNGGSGIADKAVHWEDTGLIADAVPMKQSFVFSHWTYGTGEGAVTVDSSMTYAQLAADITPTPEAITLNAVYAAAAEDTGGVEGEIITDTDGNPLEGVYVSVHVGGTEGIKIAGPVVTGADGKFSFYGLPYGIYTLVATRTLDNGKIQTITKIITISGIMADGGMVMPSGSRDTIVEVKPGTPPAAADGLDELFKDENIVTDKEDGVTQADQDKVNAGGSLEIRLMVEQKAVTDSTISSDLTKVKDKVGQDATLIPFDLEIIKTVVESGGASEITKLKKLPRLINIVIPITELQGKTIQVLRVHEGELHTLPYTDSTIEETWAYQDGNLHLNVRMFSTYVIAYKNGGGSGGGESGGGSGGDSYRYYDISLRAETGGIIHPNKTKVTVREGDSAGFDIIPDEGYRIKDVKVDGKSVGAVSAYLFRNVRKDHTLSASFEKSVTPSPAPDPEQPPAGDAGGEKDPAKLAKPAKPGQPTGGESSSGTEGGSTGDKIGGSGNELPEKAEQVEDIKQEILDDLAKKRDEAIASLPDTLTGEQRQAAIDEIGSIYEKAVEAIEKAKSASEASDLYNQAIRDFAAVVEDAGGVMPTGNPNDGRRPFILLSALLALAAVLLAVLSLRRRKEDEHKGRKRIVAVAGAAGAVLTFLLTTGWSGIAFANWWTLLVALFTAAAVYGFLNDRDEQEETPESEN